MRRKPLPPPRPARPLPTGRWRSSRRPFTKHFWRRVRRPRLRWRAPIAVPSAPRSFPRRGKRSKARTSKPLARSRRSRQKAGIAAGEKAAANVIARRADDGAATAETYRPATAAGIMFRRRFPPCPSGHSANPGFSSAPRPRSAALERAGGARLQRGQGARRKERIDSHGGTDGDRALLGSDAALHLLRVVRSVADQPGRDLARNARLYVAVTQAMDDAIIAVFDAKYLYAFW